MADARINQQVNIRVVKVLAFIVYALCLIDGAEEQKIRDNSIYAHQRGKAKNCPLGRAPLLGSPEPAKPAYSTLALKDVPDATSGKAVKWRRR
jgi:hypothetical protein